MKAKDDFALALIYVMDAHAIDFDIMWLKRKIWQVLETLVWRANNWL
jgi:hypothetical protein